jgi:transcriptional regulator with XRE-family HTH domain
MDIGGRIRKLRRVQGRTIAEVASKAGFSRSFLSKIESGATVPPVATLTKIAESLGTRIGALLDEDAQETTVHTTAAASASRLVSTRKGYSFHAFAAGRPEKRMQPFLFVAEKGRIRPRPLEHRGEEFVYVLEGGMKYRVGAVEYRLSRGDSLYFDAEEPHDLDPLTRRVAYLAVFVER